MKKIVALALCLVMVTGLMAGCQKPMDAKTLAQKVDEAVKNADSVAMNMDMDLEMELSAEGMAMSMGMDLAMDMKSMTDGSKLWYDMNMSMNLLGESEDVGMEVYAETIDGELVAYAYEPLTEMWTKASVSEAMELTEQMQGTVPMTFSEYTEDQMELAEEKVEKNGRECYVLTVTENGADMEEAFLAGMESSLGSLTGDEAAMMEQMDLSKLTVTVVYYVDAEKFVPVEMTMEVDGFGELMNELYQTIMSEMIAGSGEEIDFGVDIPTFKVTVTDMAYGGVEVPSVPQEAIDNAVDAADFVDFEDVYDDGSDYEELEELQNPPQADGSYLLSMGSDTVRVVLPEGWGCEMSVDRMLIAITDDWTSFASYSLYENWDSETAMENFQYAIEFAQEGEYYQSHSGPVQVGDFSVLELVNNDGITDYYAFVELESGLLEIELTVESDGGEAINTILAGIKVNEG